MYVYVNVIIIQVWVASSLLTKRKGIKGFAFVRTKAALQERIKRSSQKALSLFSQLGHGTLASKLKQLTVIPKMRMHVDNKEKRNKRRKSHSHPKRNRVWLLTYYCWWWGRCYGTTKKRLFRRAKQLIEGSETHGQII